MADSITPVNLLCLLPDGHISVGVWWPHPCGGYYEVERWCYGAQGRVGYDMTDSPRYRDA